MPIHVERTQILILIYPLPHTESSIHALMCTDGMICIAGTRVQFSPSQAAGLFKSTNAGRTWTRIPGMDKSNNWQGIFCDTTAKNCVAGLRTDKVSQSVNQSVNQPRPPIYPIRVTQTNT